MQKYKEHELYSGDQTDQDQRHFSKNLEDENKKSEGTVTQEEDLSNEKDYKIEIVKDFRDSYQSPLRSTSIKKLTSEECKTESVICESCSQSNSPEMSLENTNDTNNASQTVTRYYHYAVTFECNC